MAAVGQARPEPNADIANHDHLKPQGWVVSSFGWVVGALLSLAARKLLCGGGGGGGGWHGRPAKEGGGGSRNGLPCRALCFV